MDEGLTRRRFLGGMVTLVCAPPILGACGSGGGGSDGGLVVDGWAIPQGTVLTPQRYATLAAMMDAIIPGDAASPGATAAHAAWYVDQLLGAFRSDPPRIFAGGPYSGRHGGPDGFSTFQRLTRVEELRWRTFLEGSQGLPEREWNGPVVGLVQRYEEGLDAVEAAAGGCAECRFTAMPLGDRTSFLYGLDPAFLQLVYEHTVEGTYGDPVYGGNRDLLGWAGIGYEGDRQPIGYTARQMARPEEG